ncbi:Probable metabolite transport protein GIT1 [Galdieria sulphuraria]|uniref:MFS transporter, PHS family, inorganic phosphate transporter n=1 Tax=Galdieria sulphuraria TaxID=130081 RepID=M2X0L2_GALSU|nr:MFS transporter, PHS family, inorganic phosphate transporter [Galdieria sulphuraria]EME29875.1 MFS transporter, PHS family, inorganic phosphate transporter [Galdieria sulphuraria]GJD06865.1 Probable metabolite transport protein GIT1 [Galdieria sulphuraria]|eukprot:XP_005706395.1 MFS transporter, PHS family, inorganic phosphate transporter [Galdieria sulphuraria]
MMSSAAKWNIATSALSFFIASYDIFVFNSLNLVLDAEYGSLYTSGLRTRVTNTILVGAILGQAFFGICSDFIGRKRCLLVTASILLLGCILCSCATFGLNGSAYGTLWSLVICRGFLGFGVGGEWPCTAATSSETSEEVSPKKRGRIVLFVLSMQGIGNLVATSIVVALMGITLRADGGTHWTKSSLEVIWRVTLALPVLPSLIILIYRWKMLDPNQFTKNNYRTFEKHPYRVVFKRFGWRLVATCSVWFLFDVVFYTNSLFSSLIIGNVVPNATILKKAELLLALVAIGLPGYYVSLFAVDKFGRKTWQIFGLFMMGCISIVIGGVLPYLKSVPAAFIITYGIYFFFSIFGECTTYMIPSEVFPTVLRGTCHGISAAFGRTGAVVGTQIFEPIQRAVNHGSHSDILGARVVFFINGGIAFIALVVSILGIPEYKGKLLEQDDMDIRSLMNEEKDNSSDQIVQHFEEVNVENKE